MPVAEIADLIKESETLLKHLVYVILLVVLFKTMFKKNKKEGE